MQDEYDIAVEALPDDAVVETAPEPGPNSLNSILGEALADIDAAGGRDNHLLRGVIGKTTFDMLPTRKSTAQAWRAWQTASPATRPRATKMLAIAIAQAADKPHLVDRIVREINQMDPFSSDSPPLSAARSKTTPSKTQSVLMFPQEHDATGHNDGVHPRASTKLSPRDGYLEMLNLAKQSDVTKYVRARRDA